MENKVNGKTGEDFLNSIANSLAKFPNISYLAHVVDVIDKRSVVMTSATQTTAGKSGIVPIPPAFNQTNGAYALLGSDGVWHTNVSAQLTQNRFNRDTTVTNETKIFLLGSNNNNLDTSANISTVQSGNEFYISSFLATSSTNGILSSSRLNDKDIGFYCNHTESGTGAITLNTNKPHNINRLYIKDRNEEKSTTEFLLGSYIAMVSNTTAADGSNKDSIPRAGLVLGNITYSSSSASTYSPYLLKVSGNSFEISHAGDNQSIRSNYASGSGTQWILSSNNRFRFKNHIEAIPRTYSSNLPNITTADGRSNLLNASIHETSSGGVITVNGYKGAFLSGNDLKFVSSVFNGQGHKFFEGGLHVFDTGGLMLRGMDRTVIANYRTEGAIPSDTQYANTKLRSTIELGLNCYVSTNGVFNGRIEIFPKQYYTVDGIGLFDGGLDDYSTSYNYLQSTSPVYPKLEFKGPSLLDSSIYTGFYEDTISDIKSGAAYMRIEVDNAYTGNKQRMMFISDIGSGPNGSYSSTHEQTLLAITRDYSSTVSSQIDLTGNVNVYGRINSSTKITTSEGTSGLTDSDINLYDTIVNKLYAKTSAKTTALTIENTTGSKGVGDFGTQTTPFVDPNGTTSSALNVTGNTVVNIGSGRLVASSKGLSSGNPVHQTLQALPVNEIGDNDAYTYRPIIITKNSYASAAIPNHIKNAPNGYIWAYTG